jgi:hypothetical protein
MKKTGKYFLTLLVLLAFSVSIIAAASPFSPDKASGILRGNSKKCYIIGGFKLLHTMDPSVGNPEIIETGQNLNGQCGFHTKIEVLNTGNNKSYIFDVNPITGSDNRWYYRNAKKLEWNDNNPYWMIEVPAGTYEVKSFTCVVTLTMNGYLPFNEKWIDAPVSRVMGRSVNFNVQENQIVYIGDYQCSLASYICLNKITQLYWPWKLAIDLIDNFDTVNETLLNTVKDRKTAMEIVNGL